MVLITVVAGAVDSHRSDGRLKCSVCRLGGPRHISRGEYYDD